MAHATANLRAAEPGGPFSTRRASRGDRGNHQRRTGKRNRQRQIRQSRVTYRYVLDIWQRHSDPDIGQHAEAVIERFSIVNSTTRAFGGLIRLDRERRAIVETLSRIPLGAPPDQGGIDEKSLQHLLFRTPEALPIAAIDSAYDGAVPICRELRTRAGPLDALYVNPLGRLTIVEFKLWRNPQARREVIGQILDYAQELASWSYEDLQRAVSIVLDRKGNALYETVRAASGSELNEADFVDNVTRYLSRGEFLLLIVGDGIREGAENIVNFVQRHSGLHFNLALVEAALFQDGASRIIVQPRVLARTEIVQRFVVENQTAAEQENAKDDADEDSLSDWQQENLRFWSAVLGDFTFSDVTVDTPSPSKESAIYVRVQQPGIGFSGLSFVGYVFRISVACSKTSALSPMGGRRLPFVQRQMLRHRQHDEIGDFTPVN